MNDDGYIERRRGQMATEHRRNHQGTRGRRRRSIAGGTALLAAGLTAGSVVLTTSPAGATPVTIAITSRVSVTSAGAEVDANPSTWTPMSADGRYVAFGTSGALDPHDTNDGFDAYVRDRVAGTTTRVSLTDADTQIGSWAEPCGISRNGRFVGFVGQGSGLPVPDRNQLYLRDRTLGTTTLVSRASDGTPAGPGPNDNASVYAADRCPISDNGRYVAFESLATNLVPGDGNPDEDDVFRRDLQSSTTIRISASTGGAAANDHAGGTAMSADGNTIAFVSDADDLVANDTNDNSDVFVRTVSPNTMSRATTKANGAQVYGGPGSPSITGDGTKVAFASNSSDLDPGGTGQPQVFVKVRASGAIAKVSTDSGGQSLGAGAGYPSISDDGQHVAFICDRPDGTEGDPNKVEDVYLKDTGTGHLTTISVTPSGSTGNKLSLRPTISGNGTAVGFTSTATDLVRNDTNAGSDVFVRDLAVDIAPFVSTTALVKQQFVDLLGRQPSATELTEWKAKLSNGERSPDQLIDDLAHGAFAAKRAPMIRLYWAFFLRAPDKSGLDYWTGKLSAGKSLASVAAQFATSSEFQTKYGSKTNSQFVTLIYQNIFTRNPDPSGLTYWTKKLDTKAKTRGDVMVNFSESSEGKRVLAPQTDTILHELGMLRVMPSKLFLDLTLGAIKGDWVSQEQVATLRTSSGYAARITP